MADIKLRYLTDDHHYAIARLAVYSAENDHVIELLVDTLLKKQLPKAAEVVIKNMATDRLIGLLEALLSDLYPERTDDNNSLIVGIKDARKERNDIMHGLVRETDDPDVVGFKSSRPYRDKPVVQVRAPDIADIGNRLMRLDDTMYRLAREAGWAPQIA